MAGYSGSSCSSHVYANLRAYVFANMFKCMSMQFQQSYMSEPWLSSLLLLLLLLLLWNEHTLVIAMDCWYEQLRLLNIHIHTYILFIP